MIATVSNEPSGIGASINFSLAELLLHFVLLDDDLLRTAIGDGAQLTTSL